MQIRKATELDIERIRQLYLQLDADAVGYQPEHFLLSARSEEFLLGIIAGESSDFLLMEEGGETIGFSLLQEKQTSHISCLRSQRYAYILDFVVDEARRGKGYGSLLMEASKAWGRERNLDFLRLSVFPDNDMAQRFYERHGLKNAMITMESPL